ncbi:MAG: glutamine amidotransferase [Eggerthellaceae bacterium]|nr:glutamine amidotransferase [Eggerthellaceae bacterium]
MTTHGEAERWHYLLGRFPKGRYIAVSFCFENDAGILPSNSKFPSSVSTSTGRPLPERPSPKLCRGGDSEPPLTIAHLLPDLLNLYGDRGNVTVLRMRCAWRSIPVSVFECRRGDEIELPGVDVLFIGGGPDEKQRVAHERLMAMGGQIRGFVEEGGALLAICGGFQMLGRSWVLDGKPVEGVGVFDAETRRATNARKRLVGDFALESPLSEAPVVGFENHAGRTFLAEGTQPFGRIISRCGHGNDERSRADGAIHRNAIGTYAHGPLLSKNPEIADFLIAAGLERRAERTGFPASTLARIDDAEELAARAFMLGRMRLAR